MRGVRDAAAAMGVDVARSVLLHQLQRIASRTRGAHIQGEVDDAGQVDRGAGGAHGTRRERQSERVLGGERARRGETRSDERSGCVREVH